MVDTIEVATTTVMITIVLVPEVRHTADVDGVALVRGARHAEDPIAAEVLRRVVTTIGTMIMGIVGVGVVLRGDVIATAIAREIEAPTETVQ